MIFLSFESVTLVGVFLVISRGLKGFLSKLFPLNGALYVLPFNNVDNKAVPNTANVPSLKKTKKEKGSDPQQDLVDYQLGAVVANFKNYQSHDGASDYEFIMTLLATSMMGLILKFSSTLFKSYFPNEGRLKGFFDDQNIDVYLLFFIVLCYNTFLWKNLFGLGSMKIHRAHCGYMTFATLLFCLFSSLGYKNFYIGRIAESVQTFNVGLTALITSTLKFDKTHETSDYLTLNGFSWLVTISTCLLIFLTAPGIIKFVDAYQVYRKSIKKFEEALEEANQEKEARETNQKLLRQYRIGNSIQILNLVAQSIAILIHLKSINKMFFGDSRSIGELCLALTLLLTILLEMYGTHLEVKDRSHYITEILVQYKPRSKFHKDVFISKCHQLYKESLRHTLHALGKSVIPFMLLLLVFIYLRKIASLEEPGRQSSLSMQTLVEPSLWEVLRQGDYCPVDRSKGVTTIIRNFGVCVGLESIDIYSKTPFRLTGGLNISLYMNEAILNYLRLVLMNFMICKYLFTIGYILIVLTTNEEIE